MSRNPVLLPVRVLAAGYDKLAGRLEATGQIPNIGFLIRRFAHPRHLPIGDGSVQHQYDAGSLSRIRGLPWQPVREDGLLWCFHHRKGPGLPGGVRRR